VGGPTDQPVLDLVEPADFPPSLQRGPSLPYRLGIVRQPKALQLLTGGSSWYITNGTPAALIGTLLRRCGEGAGRRACEGEGSLRVLDLCAAPGGKGLAVVDASRTMGVPLELVMNDVSQDKAAAIRENLERFGLQEGPGLRVSIGDGATLPREGRGFDVVVVDAPCTNAGVLGRRPEARWR
jgi:16S rRNA (cytosine967-C5)-methyltransferase